MRLNIIPITFNSSYFNDLIELELLLWPANNYDELYTETFKSQDSFFGYIRENELVAFIQLSIRHEYVNGCTTSPVGFVEGIYVKENNRNKGIGRSLIDYGCEFSKRFGCAEIASDALLADAISHQFHQKMGFDEAERVVCYIKKIK